MKKRVQLTVRLKPEDHMAIKRMSVEKGTSINQILDILLTKSVPQKYYGDVYNKEDE